MKRPLELWHTTTPNVMWVRDHFHPKYPCFLEKKQFGRLVYECPTELFIRNVCKLTIPANLQLTIPIQGFCKLMIINDILSRIFVSHLFSRPVIWTGIQPHRIDAVLARRPADRRKRKVVAPRRSSVSCKSFFRVAAWKNLSQACITEKKAGDDHSLSWLQLLVQRMAYCS